MSIITLPLTSLIHPQILYERVNTQMVDRSRQSPEESPLSAIGAIQQMRKILDTTNKATNAMLSRVSDQKWWKKHLKAIQPHRSTSIIEDVDSNNEKFEKQGCHPFYKSVLEDAFKNKVLSTSTKHLYLVAIFNTWLYVHVWCIFHPQSDVDLKNYRMVSQELDGLNFNKSVLRTSQLDESLPENESVSFRAEGKVKPPACSYILQGSPCKLGTG